MSLGAKVPSPALHKLESCCWQAWFLSRGRMQYRRLLRPRIWIVLSFFQCVCELVHTCAGGSATAQGRQRSQNCLIRGRFHEDWQNSTAGEAVLRWRRVGALTLQGNSAEPSKRSKRRMAPSRRPAEPNLG